LFSNDAIDPKSSVVRLIDGSPVVPGEHEKLSEAVAPQQTPRSPQDWSMVYFAVGLLGLALFAAALFSMFMGKANPTNLIVGLLGIFLMTPAGGYFLLQFLRKRDAHSH